MTRNKDSKETNLRVSMTRATSAGVNDCCHSLQPQLPRQDTHVIRKPQIVPIFWGHYYVINPGVVSGVVSLVTDLATGRFMNGLAEYGVGRGNVLNQQIIDIVPPASGPATIDITNGDQTIPNIIDGWLNSNTIFPRPNVNEQSLLYAIFLPTETSIIPAGAGGWHQSGGKYNSGSSADDLFYTVVRTDGLQSATFANNLGPILGHELAEAFTDRDGRGFSKTTNCIFGGQPEINNCEVGDNCEQNPTFNYMVGTRSWPVEQYWSNWYTTCINGDQPVSLRKFLQNLSPPVNGAGGLRQLQSGIINIDFVASKMP